MFLENDGCGLVVVPVQFGKPNRMVDQVSDNVGKGFNGSVGKNVSKAILSSQESSLDLASSPLAHVLTSSRQGIGSYVFCSFDMNKFEIEH
jgi:hypothetical protein